jgi:drug/metabolite transporter (DMT)-like permease
MSRTRQPSPPSLIIHGIYEYLAGIAMIVLPHVFDFDSDAARQIGLVTGIVLLVMAVASNLPTSLVRVLPTTFHIVLDYAVPVFIVVSPFLFDFTHEDAALRTFIVVGALQLALSLVTASYPDDGRTVGALAEGTSADIERGEDTSADR